MGTRVFICLLTLAVPTTSASAQIMSEGRSPRSLPGLNGARELTIRGQVVASDPDTVLTGLIVQICNVSDMYRVVDTASLTNSGEFSFMSAEPGIYALRVVTRAGVVLGEQMASPSGMTRIDIKTPSKPNPLSGSVISLAELKHKTNKAAAKELKKANDSVRKHDLYGMIPHLEKALEFDPECIAAERNLANALLSTRQYEKAAAAYRHLLTLDEHAFVGHVGLSAALLSQYKVADAEEPARKALEMDETSELAHYLLGCSLAAQGKAPEALTHLGKALKSFPAAYLVSARILAHEGRKGEAKERVQAYLDSGDGSSRSEAEQLMNSLF